MYIGSQGVIYIKAEASRVRCFSLGDANLSAP